MKIITPRLCARAIDHLGDVTRAQTDALRADGVDGVFLYAAVISAASIENALASGLWVGFLLEGLSTDTQPTRDLGARMATNASDRLRGFGVPAGVTISVDLESETGAWPASAWMALGSGAGQATQAAGDLAGAYIAEGTGMTSLEMYGLPATSYHKGAARIVDRNNQLAEPACGWAVLQGMPIDVVHPPSGLRIDWDVCWQDYHGRSIAVVGP